MPPPPSLGNRAKYGGWDREREVEVGRGGGPFLSLRVAYIPNLSLLRSLELSKKFVWWLVVGGGGLK